MTNSRFQPVAEFTGTQDLQSLMMREGFFRARADATASYQRSVDSAARLLADVTSGRQDPFLLREAMAPQHDYALMEIQRLYPGVVKVRETMSYSDFGVYTLDVLDRMLYGYWQTATIPVRGLVKEVTLRDLRPVKRFFLNGARKPFVKHSPGEPPEERALSPQPAITYQPSIYQGMMSINWSAILNDDLGLFNDLTQSLADSWNLTLWAAITGYFWDANGPIAGLFTTANKNLLTTTNGAHVSNPPLDFQGLIDAETVLASQQTPEGNPLVLPGRRYLIVGPALWMTAQALMKTVSADISVGGGTTNAQGFPSQRLRVTPDYVTANYTVILDQWMPKVVTSGTVASKAWMVVADPATVARPAIEMGFVRGFDSPTIYQRAPNTMRMGGAVDPSMGDFLTGDIDYKAVTIFGATIVDGRSVVASTGAGS